MIILKKIEFKSSHLMRSVWLSFLLLLFLPTLSFSLLPRHFPSKCLTVSNSVFSSSIKTALDQVHEAADLLSKFSAAFHHSRLATAIIDCSELLDLSSDELQWSQNSMNNASDLRAWLSAALSNQDTCLDGLLEGTGEVGGIFKSLITKSLHRITATITNILKMVQPIQKSGASTADSGRKFPTWVKDRERQMLVQDGNFTIDVTVAADGSGNFTTVADAVAAAPDYSERRYVIYIKRGVYRENVDITKKKWNLMMIGDGMGATLISGNRNFVDGWTTFRSATFAVSGRGFIARDMSFENTAGPEKHQAVALRSDSDLSVFYRCGIHGYQDTLYAHSLRQFYRECEISGTVDFIFGNGAVVFQNCRILARAPLPNQKNSITAQGRKDPNQNTGFSIQYCNITADKDLPNSTETYLGRPWKELSRTVFMQSYMGGLIWPEGWLEWQGNFALATLYYGEYLNYGPGAGLSGRVNWPGFHVINNSNEASNFTVAQFIDGNLWLPATGVRYTSGLAE